jgi:phosphoribosylglycinamide formyltransferase 1
MQQIAILSSGSGSNAENIIRYFQNSDTVKVKLIICNNPKAGIIARAEQLDVPLLLLNRNDFYQSDKLISLLQGMNIDLIVLAGFLWLLPQNFIAAFKNKIINIHPALLPKYGGKGMYGRHVHNAVLQNKEKETGITIHLVDEIYDHGKILIQKSVPITSDDTIQTIEEKVHDLEHEYYPKVIEQFLKNDLNSIIK